MAEPLTGRELDLLRLLAAGTPHQRIARDLVVARHRQNARDARPGKLDAANRTEAAAYAMRHGLLHGESKLTTANSNGDEHATFHD